MNSENSEANVKRTVGISLSVFSDEQETILKVSEVLARTAIGLSLDGHSIQLNFTSLDVNSVPEGEI